MAEGHTSERTWLRGVAEGTWMKDMAEGHGWGDRELRGHG